MKLSFSGVSALEKVKMIKSFGVLILEKTENSVEGVNGTLLIWLPLVHENLVTL